IRIVVAGKVVPRRSGVHHDPLVVDGVDHLVEFGGHGHVVPPRPWIRRHCSPAGVNRNNVFRLIATSVPSPRWYSSHVSTKCPVPSRVVFSADTETTSSTTCRRSPSAMVAGNSTSLEALMNVVPGSGTRMAIDGRGGSSLGSQGGG